MKTTEVQIPFRKSPRSSRAKKAIINDGIKILVKSYFTQEKINKNFEFTKADEQEFIASLNSNLIKNVIRVKGR